MAQEQGRSALQEGLEHLKRLVGTVEPEIFWGAQFDLGLAWVHFPVGFGGLGLANSEQEKVSEVLRSSGAPLNALRNFVGIGTAAPTIVTHGTLAQKQQLLRRIFTCEDIWCQLFSEPGAGSDLASLSTTAVADGTSWVVNGRKVWTTLAHCSRWGLMVARTNPDVPKHQGLTCFAVDMRAPGVTVVPLRQITGEAEFNEVLLSDVVVPDEHRIGPVDEGWRVTISTLMSERAHNGDIAKKPRGAGPISYALRLASDRTRYHPALRDRLLQQWVQVETIRLTALRAEANRKAGTPGPEGSVLKLATGISTQQVMDLCMDLRGAAGMLISDYEMRQPDTMAESTMGDGGGDVDISKAFLNSLSTTIGGGTTEIQRNTIAERILGLPREPRPPSGSFSDPITT